MKQYALCVFSALSFVCYSPQLMSQAQGINVTDLIQQERLYRNALLKFVTNVKCHFTEKIFPEIETLLSNATHPYCVTFDIDSTAVDENKPQQIALPPNAPFCHYEAIPEMLELYRWLRLFNIHVFFITARIDTYKHNYEYLSATKITQTNLVAIGYTCFHGIISMPTEIFGSDKSRGYWVPTFKAEIRSKLAKNGWAILATFDDRPEIFDHAHIKKGASHSYFKHLQDAHRDNYHLGKEFRVPRRDDQI